MFQIDSGFNLSYRLCNLIRSIRHGNRHTLQQRSIRHPKSIRLDAQLSAGSQLEVSWIDGEIRLRPLAKHTVAQLSEVAGCLFKPERQRLSDADTEAAIKSELKMRDSE